MIFIPKVTEREADARFLLNHFLRLFAERTGNSVKTFSDEALQLLLAYPFPGNIRELRNIVEYCINICQSRRIEPGDLPKYLFARIIPPGASGPVPDQQATRTAPPPATGNDWQAIEKEMIIETLTQTRGNRSKAASMLGWGRTTLWRKLKTHGLVNPAEVSIDKEEG